MAFYRVRWAAKIQFRAWDQSLNLTHMHKSKCDEHHMQAQVQAAMIVNQLGMRNHLPDRRSIGLRAAFRAQF